MKVRRIDFSPDEFLVGTRGLSNAEVGMYWRACSLIYSHAGPVEIAELRRWADNDRWFDQRLERLVALGKLTSDGHQVCNQRCISELSKAHQRSITAVSNGHRGGRPPKNINGIKNPEVPSRANHQPSTITNTAPDGAVPPLFVVPPNPTEANQHDRRATRLAPDWQLSPKDRQFALGLGLDPDAVADKFRDHWIGKGRDAAKRDWSATWRNWCRNEPAHHAARPTVGGGRSREDRRGPDSELRAAARAAARFGAGGCD